MSNIKAKIVADSLNLQGDRLTTFIVTFPRIILAEFNTHRMFSRNSASSRAIPFDKMVKSVEENPFIPIAWQKDHKGMQGTEYFTEKELPMNVEHDWFERRWLQARDYAIEQAIILNKGGLTKQLCNRLLEPFMWHTVIITSGKEGLENFFNLRNHEAAEIHIQELAKRMLEVYNESTPKQLQAGEWHIPFDDKLYNAANSFKLKVSTARCARVSYTVVGEEGKEHSYENDIKLHDKLLESGHFSPFEHCAKAMSDEEYYAFIKGDKFYSYDLYSKDVITHKVVEDSREITDSCFGWCNNFKGFIQYRYLIDKNK
jgi:thymidylate synthase ThyX